MNELGKKKEEEPICVYVPALIYYLVLLREGAPPSLFFLKLVNQDTWV